jgi:hypothetical protein
MFLLFNPDPGFSISLRVLREYAHFYPFTLIVRSFSIDQQGSLGYSFSTGFTGGYSYFTPIRGFGIIA